MCLRTDQGGEFMSNEFKMFCEEKGISRQLTTTFTAQQNGVAERKNRIRMNMVRCILKDKEVPKRFWSEATRWAVHILNRSPTSVLKEKTPEEMWSGVKPTVDYFRVFRCLAHVHVPDQRRKKLDGKSVSCVLIRVSNESKGYHCFNPITETVVTTRDVEEQKGWNWEKINEKKLIWGGCDSDDDLDDEIKTEAEQVENPENQSPPPSPPPPENQSPTPLENQARGVIEAAPVRRPRNLPSYWQDYTTGE